MPQPGQPPTPSGGELLQEDLTPTVLELQKLILDRLKNVRQPGRVIGPDEVAVVSITSCNSYSCR